MCTAVKQGTLGFMLASTAVCIVVIYFLILYSFRPGWGGGVGVIGPGDSRHFSRVTSGVRFCVWAVLCGHAPLPKRFCVWAAFCGAILLTSMLVGCLWGQPSAPPPSPCSCFFMGWGAVHGITSNLAGRPLGRGFVLWAVLCGHAPLPERFVCGPLSAGLSC
jgi:hypothetical protein